MLLRERNNFQPIATTHPHIIPKAQHNSSEKADHFLMPLQNCVFSDKDKHKEQVFSDLSVL